MHEVRISNRSHDPKDRTGDDSNVMKDNFVISITGTRLARRRQLGESQTQPWA